MCLSPRPGMPSTGTPCLSPGSPPSGEGIVAGIERRAPEGVEVAPKALSPLSAITVLTAPALDQMMLSTTLALAGLGYIAWTLTEYWILAIPDTASVALTVDEPISAACGRLHAGSWAQ